jgi:hypothetical protein
LEQAVLSSPKFNIKSTSNPNNIKKIILYWQRQGSNQKELIPENALFHCCTQENIITF